MKHQEVLSVQLNNLVAYLSVVENGVYKQYSFRLNRDRQLAELITSTFDDGGRCIGNAIRVDALETYRNDPTLSDMCRWMIVGMFGVPLRYGSTETQIVAA